MARSSTVSQQDSPAAAAHAEGRAAVIAGPRRLAVETRQVGEPGPGQVRIRLEGCGVCASNIPVWEGRPWFEYPFEGGSPGHEGWGVVDRVGSDVTHLAPGDRVAALSYNAYADFDTADASAVVKLPASLADVPFPAEPLGCAMNVFRRSDIQPGQTVAVVGIGFLGGLLVQLAKRAGARVVAVSRREFALDVAKRCGADEAFGLNDSQETIARICELSDKQGCERVIEATGKQQALDLATEITCIRGRLIIAGYHQDEPRQVNMQQWNWRGLDVINAHERDPQIYTEGMQAAVDEVTAGRLDPTPLYTHHYSLEELDQALDATAQRPNGFLKALIWMER